MTVAAAFASSNFRLEYILAIEGVGWATDELDLSSGFDGDVFVTNDFDGTLASDLGCTIHKTMSLPSGLGDNLDPITTAYDLGGLGAVILDTDGFLAGAYQPHVSGSETTLNGGIGYDDTTIVFASGANFATGGTAWIGGRELVKLGTKSTHTFTGSTRGYLGTAIGSASFDRGASGGAFSWSSGSTVHSVHRFWYDRTVALYAHVPGETVGNCKLIWQGKLRQIGTPADGITWQLSAVGDMFRLSRRNHRAIDWRVAASSAYVGNPESIEAAQQLGVGVEAIPMPDNSHRWLLLNPPEDNLSDADAGKYDLAAWYCYRWEPGGTKGMISSWDAQTVQASDITFDSTTETDVIAAFCKVDGDIYHATGRELHGNTETGIVSPLFVRTKVWAQNADVGQTPLQVQALTDDSPVRFLLDNMASDYRANRFAVNKHIVDHPIEVFLCFLLSQNSEYFIGDVTGTSTATQLDFTAPGWTTNQWAGFTAFGVEDSNKYWAREIASNTASSLVLAETFEATPTASKEYQIRNSKFDLLPLGWGLGVDARKVDVEAWLRVRDEHMPLATVADFMIGTKDSVDLFALLYENLLQPYGVQPYIDRDTGKLSARYAGSVVTNGVIADYTAVTASDFLQAPTLDYAIDRPVSSIAIAVRSKQISAVDWHFKPGESKSLKNFDVSISGDSWVPTWASMPTTMSGSTATIRVKSEEIENAYVDTATVSLSALFNSNSGDAATIIARAKNMLRMYNPPAPIAQCLFSSRLVPLIQAGSLVSMTLPTWPINPFTGTRGWSAVLARVLSTSINDDKPSLSATVELLAETRSGKIAPAVKSAAYSSAGGNHYIDCATTESFVQDEADDKDWYHFAVDDRLEIRSKLGALKEGVFTITGFGGATLGAAQSTPSGATPARIWVSGTITTGFAAGDYATFAAWSGSNTARMDTFAAYADTNDTLAVSDDGMRYG